MFKKILQSLLEQLLLPSSEIGTAQGIALISDQDPELGKLLNSLLQAEEAHNFIRNDYELRHKLKDIWTLQTSRTRADVDQFLQLLTDYCNKNDLKLPETERFQM